MGTIIRSQAWFASWDGTMTTQEDWRLRNVIRSVTFISGDSSFPWYIEASPHCNNLRRKVNKEGSTKPQTSVREINSNSRTSKFFRFDGLLLFCIIMGLRSASSAIILFSCLNRNISLVRVYWRYNRVSNAFHSKITWNYIFQAANCRRKFFIFRLLEEQQ